MSAIHVSMKAWLQTTSCHRKGSSCQNVRGLLVRDSVMLGCVVSSVLSSSSGFEAEVGDIVDVDDIEAW